MNEMNAVNASLCGTHSGWLFRRSQNRQLMRGGRA